MSKGYLHRYSRVFTSGLLVLIVFALVLPVASAQEALPAASDTLAGDVPGSGPLQGAFDPACPGTSSAEFVEVAWNSSDIETVTACIENMRTWEDLAWDQQHVRWMNGQCHVQPTAEQLDEYFAANWALADLAAGYFILGLRWKAQDNMDQAEIAFNVVIYAYPCAYAWDPSGWFWSLADASRAALAPPPPPPAPANNGSAAPFAFNPLCPGASSADFAGASWGAGAGGNVAMAQACVHNLSLWRPEASAQQTARLGVCNQSPWVWPDPDTSKIDAYFANYWALTDVGIGYFNLGLAYKNAGRPADATTAFNIVLNRYSCAWVWDPNGWFWPLVDGVSNNMP